MKRRKQSVVDGDVKRYAVLVFVGIVICFWLLVTYDLEFRAAIVYILMGFGGLGIYVLFRELFGRL